jgi:hypothetical protein
MAGDAQVTLAVLPLSHSRGGLRAAVVRLRRPCRDVRDRTARRGRSWRSVAMAGMATGSRVAFLLIRHPPSICKREVVSVLRKRWFGLIVRDAKDIAPSWDFPTDDAVELSSAGRGVEPLRIVVAAQRVRGHAPASAEPMVIVL